MLAYAKQFKSCAERREFVLRIPMDGGVACTQIRLGAEMDIADLKAIAAAASGVRAENQRMNHLGNVLTTGTLVAHGFRPGS